MRLLSQRVMQRIHRDYRAIVALNTGFIAGGVTGLITTTTAAFLHNELTFAVTVANTRSLLKSAKQMPSFLMGRGLCLRLIMWRSVFRGLRVGRAG